MDANEAQRYARIAGIFLVISLLAGGFGESYVPGEADGCHGRGPDSA
jgi:hypothetical protein